MDYLKANYDRILLVVASLALVGASAHALLGLGNIRDEYVKSPAPASGVAFEPNQALSRIRSEVDQLVDPAKFAWREGATLLFASRVYLLRDNQLIDIFESDLDLFPGIPNKWVLDNKLDYTDTGLPSRDADGDGFTNLEEFSEKTDPRDPESKPGSWKKLRMLSSKIDKLRTKFVSLPTGSLDQVAINTISAENPTALSGGTKFYKKGETIKLAEILPNRKESEKETDLKFVDAKMIKRFNPSINADEQIPQITLRNMVDNREIDLLMGEVKDSPYSLATLQDIRPGGQSFELRTGESFSIDGKSYKLIDVDMENAIISDIESGERHSIPQQTMSLPPASKQNSDS
jgi:hypothetical protein